MSTSLSGPSSLTPQHPSPPVTFGTATLLPLPRYPVHHLTIPARSASTTPLSTKRHQTIRRSVSLPTIIHAQIIIPEETPRKNVRRVDSTWNLQFPIPFDKPLPALPTRPVIARPKTARGYVRDESEVEVEREGAVAEILQPTPRRSKVWGWDDDADQEAFLGYGKFEGKAAAKVAVWQRVPTLPMSDTWSEGSRITVSSFYSEAETEVEEKKGGPNPCLGVSDRDLQRLERMHSDFCAGQLPWQLGSASLPSPEDKAYRGAYWEEGVCPYTDAIKFFDHTDDGRDFRNPFSFEGGREVSQADLDEILSISTMEEGMVGNTCKECVERAVRDESLPGVSDQLAVWLEKMTETVADTAAEEPTSEPIKALGRYDFIGANSWSVIDDEIASEEKIEITKELVSPESDGPVFPGGSWSVAFGKRRLSSFYSVSPPGSPVLHAEDEQTMPFSRIGNPWTPTDAQLEFDPTAIEHFAEVDVEALVASTQDARYELEDTDSGKGLPGHFSFTPHKPDRGCMCYHCEKYYFPLLEDFTTDKHDPNRWCYCLACEMFYDREARLARRKKAYDMFRKAKFNEFSTSTTQLVEQGKDESVLPDMSTISLPDDGVHVKEKKVARLGDWIKRHLRSPSLGE